MTWPESVSEGVGVHVGRRKCSKPDSNSVGRWRRAGDGPGLSRAFEQAEGSSGRSSCEGAFLLKRLTGPLLPPGEGTVSGVTVGATTRRKGALAAFNSYSPILNMPG